MIAWFIMTGMLCAFPRTFAAENNCVTRDELKMELQEISLSNMDDVLRLKDEIQQLKEDKIALEKRIQNLESSKSTKEKPIVIKSNENLPMDKTDNSPLDAFALKNNENKATIEAIAVSDSIYTNMKASKAFNSELAGRHTFKKARKDEKRLLLDVSRLNVHASSVAFSVVLNVTELGGLGLQQVLKFDKSYTNEGNAFDLRTGIFTAPVSGIYAFSITLFARPNEKQFLYIMKDGIKAFHVWATGTFHNTVSKTIVLLVNKGQEIWVQTSEHPGYSHTIFGDEQTTFTGFLLYAKDE